jgi:hypothetical protein
VSRKAQLAGWSLFILSALSYIADAIHLGDMISLPASLLFLFACIVFVYPILRSRHPH